MIFFESLRLVGEPVLVDDQAGVEVALSGAPTRSLKEQHLGLSSAPGQARPSRKFAVVYWPGMAIRRPPAATSSIDDPAR